MTFTVSPELLLSLLGQAVLLGIAWGLIRGELKSQREAIKALQDERTKFDAIDHTVTRLEEQVETIFKRLDRLPREILNELYARARGATSA